jgi:hypothetical protein
MGCGRMAQAVECLPGKREGPEFKPQYSKKRNKTKQNIESYQIIGAGVSK